MNPSRSAALVLGLALLVAPAAWAQAPERPADLGAAEAGAAQLPEPAAEGPPAARRALPTAPEPREAERGGPRLTLEQAQRIALERSPSIRAAALEVDRAEAMIEQGWAYILPQIRGSASYQMADQPTVVSFGASPFGGSSPFAGAAQEIVVSPQHTASLGLVARQPLFSGQAIPLIRMAHQSRDLTALSVEQARAQLALTVARAFYSSIAARHTIELLDRQIALVEEHLQAARARLEVQAGLAIDVARAELQREATRSQRENAVLAYENARDAVALLLAMPLSELPPFAEPTAPEGGPLDEDALVERAFRGRLDLEMTRGQIGLAERDLQSVWMQFLPSLDLSWSLSHTLTEVSDFGGRRTSWYLGIVASIPIFDGGVRYGQLRDRRARLAQARLSEESLELSVASEVRRAYRAWRTSLTTFEISERQLTLARETYRLAMAAYEAGAASNLEVVDAQRTLVSAEVELELQRLSAQLSLVELLASLEISTAGGGAPSGGGAPAGASSAPSAASAAAAPAAGASTGAPAQAAAGARGAAGM